MWKQFTMALTLTGTAANLLFLSASMVRADVAYQIDGGKSQTAFGIVDNSCVTESGHSWGDFLWLNSFSVQPEGEVINSVSFGLGTPVPIAPRSAKCTSNIVVTDSGLSQSAGEVVRVLLYGDPDNTNDPRHAQLLTSVDTVVVLPDRDDITGEDVLQTIAIPETPVSGNFFVGILFPDQKEGEFPAPISTTNPLINRSWAAYRFLPPFGQLTDPPVTDLANTKRLDPITVGNWLLRASGKSAELRSVAEPDSSLGLLALSAVGIGALLKRHI